MDHWGCQGSTEMLSAMLRQDCEREREGHFTAQSQVTAHITQSRIPDSGLQQFSTHLVPGLVE